jgi:hypothetical protein
MRQTNPLHWWHPNYRSHVQSSVLDSLAHQFERRPPKVGMPPPAVSDIRSEQARSQIQAGLLDATGTPKQARNLPISTYCGCANVLYPVNEQDAPADHWRPSPSSRNNGMGSTCKYWRVLLKITCDPLAESCNRDSGHVPNSKYVSPVFCLPSSAGC